MSKTPQFVSLVAHVLDNTRITLNLKTTNFPPVANVFFNSVTPSLNKTKQDPTEVINNSPYPTVELSLLDQHNTLVAQTTIIEHKEESLSLTLHLRNPQPGTAYTAKAEMIHQQQIIHTLNTPFILKPAYLTANNNPLKSNGAIE